MRGILYYTDNQCQERILLAVRKQLIKSCKNIEIVSVSQYPINFGNNVVVNIGRSVLSMFKQIVIGLEKLKSDIVYFAEHDVLYHPSHFEFVPNKEGCYFNTNIWTVETKKGKCLFVEGAERTSQMIGFRHQLLESYKKKLILAEKYFKKSHRGFGRLYGYEPKDLRPNNHFKSKHPNLDIKHGNNVTPPRFKIHQYRTKTQRKIKDSFIITERVPFWGKMGNNFDNFLRNI